MYRAGLESILGLRRRDHAFALNPCIPFAWNGFQLTLRAGATRYEIAVENPQSRSRGVAAVEVDGVAHESEWIPWIDDGITHRVRVVMGEPAPARLADKRQTVAR
jgi:cyclic beta-1,2-glucan synthetase